MHVGGDCFEAVEDGRDLVEESKHGGRLTGIHDKYVVIMTT